MTPEDVRWAVFQLQIQEWITRLENILRDRQKPLWGCQWKNDKDYQKFMAAVLRPLAKSDLDL